VAQYYGHPQEKVELVLRTFLKKSSGECEANSKQLAKILAVPPWLVQLQEQLCRRGYEHRAFELFFNCERNQLSPFPDANVTI
jgi:hypothetical protein